MASDVGFSVIIPVHNKLPHLERSVNSVLHQTHKNLEVILIDDASTDGSSKKLQDFTDKRVKVLRREVPGAGGYAARNLGINHARMEWVCFLDADDEWKPNVLETVAQLAATDGEVEVISWSWFIKEGNSQSLNGFSVLHKKYDCKTYTLIDFLTVPPPIWTGAVAIKKGRLIAAGMFPEKDFTRGGDMDTWVRCLWGSKKNVWLNQAMSYYHTDSVNMVTRKEDRNPLFIFSPFLQNLITTTDDKELREAILFYQNRYLYIILNGRVYEGKNIDYKLLSRMHLGRQALWLGLKLHLNRLRHAVGLI
ncbi:glycosyltransferase family 2 protein [Pontibacter anaerobius]|uniref:Glycosyltransferase family A protein n=1 Tax=Pontibacter anaerobius TaxID=2993940 RepID=A0ABT3RDL4_9BACT|nr:glycosyltransferase family A protein [Pontibacter anaerobius]MCX2739943.1 glycosyltransferase family A protein [Pontibacter anaerobius]